MSASLDPTIGGPNANSYVSEADADAYFANRLNASAWSALTEGADAKKQALIMATQRLEYCRYKGLPTSDTQRLQWPRVLVYDLPFVNGERLLPDARLFPSDRMPTPLIEATCELALYYLNQGTTDPRMPTGLEPFRSLAVGPLKLEMNAEATDADALPGHVSRALAPLLAPASGQTRLVRA